MDDAARVRHGEGAEHLGTEARGCVGFDGAAGDAVGQGFAVEPFHGQVGLALRGGAVGHVADDAGMDQAGQHLGLAREPLDGDVLRPLQDLQRNWAAIQKVAAAEHDAHAAAADQALNLEALAQTPARGRLTCGLLLRLDVALPLHGQTSEYHGHAPGCSPKRKRAHVSMVSCC